VYSILSIQPAFKTFKTLKIQNFTTYNSAGMIAKRCLQDRYDLQFFKVTDKMRPLKMFHFVQVQELISP
jgi:hypothetical protein